MNAQDQYELLRAVTGRSAITEFIDRRFRPIDGDPARSTFYARRHHPTRTARQPPAAA